METKFMLDNKKEIIVSINDDLSNLSSHSEATVFLINEGKFILELANDNFLELINTFNNILLKALCEEHVLPEPDDGFTSVGYKWNKWAHNLPEEGEGEVDIYNGFWLWSTKETGTWLYKNNKSEITLEISPIYRWHFEDPDSNVDFVTFNKFIKNYKEYLKKKIDIETVKEWRSRCQNYIDLINNS